MISSCFRWKNIVIKRTIFFMNFVLSLEVWWNFYLYNISNSLKTLLWNKKASLINLSWGNVRSYKNFVRSVRLFRRLLDTANVYNPETSILRYEQEKNYSSFWIFILLKYTLFFQTRLYIIKDFFALLRFHFVYFVYLSVQGF